MKYWINAITQEWGTLNGRGRPGTGIDLSAHGSRRAGRGVSRLEELEMAGFAVMDREEFEAVFQALTRRGIALARASLAPDFPVERFLQDTLSHPGRFELCLVS